MPRPTGGTAASGVASVVIVMVEPAREREGASLF